MKDRNYCKIPVSKETRKLKKEKPLIEKKEELDLRQPDQLKEWIRRHRPSALHSRSAGKQSSFSSKAPPLWLARPYSQEDKT